MVTVHKLNKWNYEVKHLILAIKSFNKGHINPKDPFQSVRKRIRKLLPLCLMLQRYGINVNIPHNLDLTKDKE